MIIYSHGNAADIGCCIEYMEVLGSSLDCDIIFYDYEGYGYSTGEASCSNLPRDLRTVYNYTCSLFSPDKIYLMGESSNKKFYGILIFSWKCSDLRNCC